MSDHTHRSLACKANMATENALYKFITITITITKKIVELEKLRAIQRDNYCVLTTLFYHQANRLKLIIKRNLRSALIDTSAWEDIAKHRDIWRQSVKAGVSKAEANARVQATCKRAARKERAASARDSTRNICATCNRLPLHNRATQSYKILTKSPALAIASLRRGCHKQA